MIAAKPVFFVPDVDFSPNFSIAKDLMACGQDVISGSANVAKAPFRGMEHIHYPISDNILSEADRNAEISRRFCDAVDEVRPVLGFCGSDRSMGLFQQIQNHLPEFRACLPAWDTCKALTSKSEARRRFEAEGLPLPAGRIYAAGEDVEPLAWRYPLVFKYDSSESSLGVKVLKSPAELELMVAKATLLDTPFLLETFLGATREFSYTFLVSNGALLPLYGLEKQAHFRTSYSTTIRFLSKEEELARFHEYDAGLAGYLTDGFYCAQFKQSPDGLKLIEVNARMGNNFRIISRVMPTLAAMVGRFYAQDARWEQMYLKLRSGVRPAYGVSVVEDACARMAQMRGAGSLRSVWRELKEVGRVVGFSTYVDDYFANLVRSPSYTFGYYRAFLSTVVSERHSTAELRKMVVR